jgi:ESCRT-II complex subunit VPS36
LISPKDLQKACECLQHRKLPRDAPGIGGELPVVYKELKNGVRVLQLAALREHELLQSAVSLARERGSLSELELSEALKINPLIAKQCLLNAEDKGFVARDESVQGLRFYENLLRVV